jgi:hypothetical protein
MTEWQASPKVREFRAQRTSLRKNTPRPVTQRVRSFSGIVWRKVDSQVEQGRCPHAHSKPSSATKCAEALAKRLNRAAKRSNSETL